MGAFRMADLVGGDVVSFVNQNFLSSYGDRSYESPLRKIMTDERLLGEKTKRGFYDYAGGKPEEWAGLDALLVKARAAAKLPQVRLLFSFFFVLLLFRSWTAYVL
jgi:3-hydroxyacyl-CoA dehydrogenase